MLLEDIQHEFYEALTNNESLGCAQPIEHLVIYQNNIFSSLVKTLKDTYPLVCKLLGDDFFYMTAKKYIEQYPSRSGNLNDYGEYFNHFLSAFAPVRTLPYLIEIANFEWACHLVYLAANPIQTDFGSLETISPEQYEQLYFKLHPASRLMKFSYPMLHIIDLCAGKISGPINLNLGGVNLLIFRYEWNISLINLSLADFTFLYALQENLSLAIAANKASAIDKQFSLAKSLPYWIEKKVITDY